MKKWSCYFFLIQILIVFLFFSIASAAYKPKEPFKWFDDEDYPPFIYKDKNGKPAGFFKELMIEIFKRMNIRLQCKLYPWKRAQEYVKKGLADGMVTVLTKKRSIMFVATEPLFVNHERIFARKDNPKIKEILNVKSLKDLKPFKVVETIGSGWSEEHMKGLNIVWVPNFTIALNMLAKGRVDIYLLGKYPGMADIINKINENSDVSNDLKKIIMVKHSLAEIRFCLLIRKTSNYLYIIPQFNKTLKQLKKDGTYKTIFRKFFPNVIENQIIEMGK